MPRLIAFLLIVATGGYLFLYNDADEVWPIKNKPRDVLKVAAFGDSLVRGVGAAMQESYPSQLGKMLGSQVKNFGRSGDTSEVALRRLPALLEYQPNLVIVTLGGNDMMKRVPDGEVVGNLQQIFLKLQQQGAMVVYTAIDPPIANSKWNSEVKRICQKMGVLYIPRIMKGFWGNRKMMADQIHPNGKGYKIMAERVYGALSKAMVVSP